MIRTIQIYGALGYFKVPSSKKSSRNSSNKKQNIEHFSDIGKLLASDLIKQKASVHKNTTHKRENKFNIIDLYEN